MRLKLTIRIDVDPNGITVNELIENLHQAAFHIMDNGMVTGPTEAIVDDWDEQVEVD